MRVRESSGNTEQDIGFSGDTLDAFALLSFVSTASGYVTRLYDQSGNGRDLTQTDTAKQPIIVNAGSLVTTASGVPTMTLTGSLTLTRTDACGLTGAPAVTLGVRFKTLPANYPVMARIGDTDLNTTRGGFSIIPDPGGGNSRGYISIFDVGPDFNLLNVSNSHYYVARAAAGARCDSFTLRQDGANCTVHSIAGSGASLMNLTNECTTLGGGGITGASSTGDANTLCVYNEDMDGTRLAELEVVLALHQ